MKIELSKLYTRIQDRIMQEDGGDLTQVALVIALVAMGATAGINSVATTISSAFNVLASTFSSFGGVVIHHL